MGKGDKKTKRGKVAIGTYGVRRPRPSLLRKTAAANASDKPAKAEKSAEKKAKAPAKKAAAKKAKD